MSENRREVLFDFIWWTSIFGRVILLVRNPFDTLLAEFNRLASGKNHTGFADKTAFEEREYSAHNYTCLYHFRYSRRTVEIMPKATDCSNESVGFRVEWIRGSAARWVAKVLPCVDRFAHAHPCLEIREPEGEHRRRTEKNYDVLGHRSGRTQVTVHGTKPWRWIPSKAHGWLRGPLLTADEGEN